MASVITIRPSWKKAARSVLKRATPMVLLLVLFQFWAAGQSGGRGGPVDVLLALILIFAVVADYAYRMTTVLRLTPEALAISSGLARTRQVPRSQIRGVALRRFASYPFRTTFGVAVVYGESGRRFATMPESIWEDDDVHRLQTSLGSTDSSYREVTRDEFKSEFPGSLRNYWGWVLAAIVVVVIFVGATIKNR
jgi:hypothetical protein